jgi:hypothetical protein
MARPRTKSIVGVIALCVGIAVVAASLAGLVLGRGGQTGAASANPIGVNPPAPTDDGNGTDDSGDRIFESSLVGVPAGMTGTAGTIRGVPAGAVPWAIDRGEVRIESDGQLRAEVEGLLIVDTGTNLDGTTGPVTGVRASLTCHGTNVTATTSVVPLSSDGNAQIEQTISLPRSCVGPIVLIRVGSTMTNPGPSMGPWIAASGLGAAEQEPLDLRAVPFVFDPEDLGIVFSDWVNGIGLPDNMSRTGDGWQDWGQLEDINRSQGLLISKNGATAANASAGATIEGVAGITLMQLGLDVRSGGHCGAGAPRFNVLVDMNGSRSLFFFGCAAGDRSSVPGVSPEQGWTRVRFSDADAVAADGMTTWPGFGLAKVVSIKIVFDDGTDAGPDFSGLVILDNLEVNGTLVGQAPSTDTSSG